MMVLRWPGASVVLALLFQSYYLTSTAFTTQTPPSICFHRQRSSISSSPFRRRTSIVGSSVGDGPPTPPPSSGGGGDGGDDWDNFLNRGEESDNLRKARAFMSEQSLPISFDSVEEDNAKDENENSKDEDDGLDVVSEVEDNSSALSSASKVGALLDGPSADVLQNNPYMKVVSSLSPSDLISKFTSTAHPRVQNAVRSTILGLIGGLPKMAFDTTTITSGERLASLMFQLEMTGYMFKNAEYRLSLSQSLGITTTSPSLQPSSNLLLTGDSASDEEADEEVDPLRGKVSGKIKVRYGDGGNSTKSTASEEGDSSSSSDALELEVDAAAYMSELRSEVSKLRDELSEKRQAKEEALRKDLLAYIRTLPQQELRSLTNTISEDVLVAMKGLVNVVMAGIGEGQISPNTVTEQSGEAMAQLCMWQLVVGYNLRELEVREEMKKSLFNGWNNSTGDDGVEGVDFSEPGMLE